MVAPDICLAQAGMASKQLNGSSWCSARARAWLPQSLPSGNIISGTTKYLPLVPSYGLIRCSTFSPQHLYRCRLSTQLDPLKFNTPMSVHLCLQSVADPHSKGGGSDGVKAFFRRQRHLLRHTQDGVKARYEPIHLELGWDKTRLTHHLNVFETWDTARHIGL